LHLKRTARGAGRELRGRSAVLARQEAWALLLVHNMIAAMAARAAVTAGTSLAAVEIAQPRKPPTTSRSFRRTCRKQT
jgi:hypothetical protein